MMSIIKRYRKEFLTNNNTTTVKLKISFLGIPVFEDRFDSMSHIAIDQFKDDDVKSQPTGFYDTTKIGFKQE